MNNFYKEYDQITAWLDKHKISNYELIPDSKYVFVVNVYDDVELQNKNLKFIPVKFNEVEGSFFCDKNKLTSLEFCPVSVNEDFACGENKLKSLKFCPFSGDDFNCGNNQLISLEFCPQIINGNFFCCDNKLTSLEFSPIIIEKIFNCENNDLRSLEFCPETVNGNFVCTNNPRLGLIQQITDFNEIYQEHLKIKEKINFQDQLEIQLTDKKLSKLSKNKI